MMNIDIDVDNGDKIVEQGHEGNANHEDNVKHWYSIDIYDFDDKTPMHVDKQTTGGIEMTLIATKTSNMMKNTIDWTRNRYSRQHIQSKAIILSITPIVQHIERQDDDKDSNDCSTNVNSDYESMTSRTERPQGHRIRRG